MKIDIYEHQSEHKSIYVERKTFIIPKYTKKATPHINTMLSIIIFLTH